MGLDEYFYTLIFVLQKLFVMKYYIGIKIQKYIYIGFQKFLKKMPVVQKE